ncbi:MAG: alkylhydroperoxidase [Acidimicrobiia bacterium]|nr:MAG: alkylhydroperoxidase [Acidimicrobiia bacterium]
MSEYLPEQYRLFRDRYPEVAAALDGLGRATQQAGPLDPKTQRLVKLGIAMALGSEGAVRSNVRRALQEGASPDEIRHVALLVISTGGFPRSIAAMGWVDEVLDL